MATGTAFSDKMEQDILNRYLKNTTTVLGTLPSVVYVGLGTAGADTGLTGESSFASRGYTRQSIGFGTVGTTAGSITAPTAAVTFGQCTGANWGTITHFGIFDSTDTSTGNMLFWGALGSSVDINVNDRFEFATNSITITVD